MIGEFTPEETPGVNSSRKVMLFWRFAAAGLRLILIQLLG